MYTVLQQLLVLILVSLARVARAEHRCKKDAVQRMFYDGEAFWRDCSECNLDGDNNWDFDCYPCCMPKQAATPSPKMKADGLSSGEITGIVAGVLFTIGAVAFVVWRLKSLKKDREMNWHEKKDATSSPIQAVDDDAVAKIV